MFERRISMKSVLVVLVFLAGLLTLVSCEEESDTIVDHEYDSSCLSCHTDSDALLALAEEETGGDEEAGEG